MLYDPSLAQKLLEPGELIDVNGLAVECKPVPDGDGRAALDPRALAIELEMARNTLPRSAEPTIEQLRAEMGCFNRNLCRREIYTRYVEIPTSRGAVPAWGYYPRHMGENRPALVYVHGGAFFGGSPFTVENPCRLIADEADCVVWNLDYGLAPEQPYPIACTQVYESAAWLHEHADRFGTDAGKIALAGDSAGGNLCAVAAQMDRDRGTGFVAAQALLYAKLTFTNHALPGYARDESVFEIVPEQRQLLPGLLHIGSDESNTGDGRVYLRGQDPTQPYISPAFGDCAGLPRALMILAEYDGLRLEGEFYARKLQSAGVPVRVLRYRGVAHGFFDRLGALPQSEAAALEIAALLKGL